MTKLFVSPDSLLSDSFELAVQIFESGYRPSFIVGVWRGGTPVGIAIQEVLEVLGCPTDHFAIRTSSYEGASQTGRDVKVSGLQHIIDTITVDDRLLIIDDIFDSGRSIDAIITALSEKCRRNMPSDIRVATLYYKPARNTTPRKPDFYIHETDAWTVFPHELQGLSKHELRQNKVLPDRFFGLLPKS